MITMTQMHELLEKAKVRKDGVYSFASGKYSVCNHGVRYLCLHDQSSVEPYNIVYELYPIGATPIARIAAAVDFAKWVKLH
jgi:hypothetical protein